MPPPSPVWDWDYKVKGAKIFNDTTFKMAVNVDGYWYLSKDVPLKVKQTPPAKEKVFKVFQDANGTQHVKLASLRDSLAGRRAT